MSILLLLCGDPKGAEDEEGVVDLGCSVYGW